ncbi:MAG TPA: V-type ATP synthase subunit E family protein [Candidatus Thermoplasmatota archaeon]|nr:V-type ATP synthase subunit E family protein [Candidatus Thermoplasmatota archaeon]
MSLEAVLGDVRRDGDERAKQVLQKAREEANAILAEARAKAQAIEQARLAEAARDAQQLLQQAQSRAESEGRKVVLSAEASLRAELRQRLLKAFADLPTKAREAHLAKLLARAQQELPGGRVWGSEKDAAYLKGQKAYSFAGTEPVAGGIIVESEDGTVRLDLTYETLLESAWRDVLKAEAALFA